MTNQEIRELLEIFRESGVAEMEVQRGDNRLRLRGSSSGHDFGVSAPMSAPAVHSVSAPPTPTPQAAPAPAISAATVSSPSGVAAAKPSAADAGHTIVKSPIVGTYYDAPSPDAAPFVKVGDTVEPGQVLCIIESMKLMNEIEAEVAGIIVHKLCESGRPVEYGEALFAVGPR